MKTSTTSFTCDRCGTQELIGGSGPPKGWAFLSAFVRFNHLNEGRDVVKGDFCPACAVAIQQNYEKLDLRKP